MVFENIPKVFSKPKYLLVGAIVAVIVGWIYIGPLTRQEMYTTWGWIFAILFPVLVGGIVAAQIFNYRERRSCPVSSTGGGVLGGFAGIITVACAACPLIILSWIGLGTAISGSILGGPWLKLVSLILLVASFGWATKR